MSDFDMNIRKEVVLSIIIVSYKNIQVLKKCVESIYKFEDASQFEIIIVDNSPNRDFIYNEFIRIYPDIPVIDNDNKGFGEGNNRGAEISSGKYLLFLNADTYLIEPTLCNALKEFNDSKLGLFGVKILTTSLNSGFSFFYEMKYDFWHGRLLKIKNKRNIFESDKMYIAGADLFIRKDLFFQAGMFDENIFMYVEEPDLGRRVKKLGYNVDFFDKYRIVHIGGGSSDESVKSIFSFKTRLKSEIYFAKKYNLNIKKAIRNEVINEHVKIIILKLLGKKNEMELEKEKKRILNKFLKKCR